MLPLILVSCHQKSQQVAVLKPRLVTRLYEWQMKHIEYPSHKGRKDEEVYVKRASDPDLKAGRHGPGVKLDAGSRLNTPCPTPPLRGSCSRDPGLLQA